MAHSGTVPSGRQTATSSRSNPNNETGRASRYTDIDSLYFAAMKGKIDPFQNHERPLNQLLTPNKNTIVHIHITTRSKWDRSLDFLENILEKCPDLLRKVNDKGETLLHIAARHGHDDIVEFLLRRSGETDHNDQENGNGSARQILIMTNRAGDTALHEAVRFKRIDVVKRLINKDPDYSYGANTAGETPIYLAAERGYGDILKIMTSNTRTQLAYVGPTGKTALHAAVIRNDWVVTSTILQKISNLNKIKDERGWIPIHYAAYHGYKHIVGLLLLSDASVAYSTTDDGEKTALHIAASRGKKDVMEEIITNCPGCSELVDVRGWNVVHFAVESKNVWAVNFVLQCPLLTNLINESNNDGNTPFHQLAALDSNLFSFFSHSKVDKLAFNGQNLNAIDITAAKEVISRKHINFMARLKNSGSRRGQRVEVNNDRNIIEEFREVKAAHLVVATLIAAIAFAAGIAVPGGYTGQGTAILTRSVAFKTFVISNTTAMMLSSSAVIFHLAAGLDIEKKWISTHFTFEIEAIFFAVIAMVIAFISGTYAVLAPSGLATAACVTGCLLFTFKDRIFSFGKSLYPW